jgi:hypothetical protein
MGVTRRPANGPMQRHNGTWDEQNQIPKSRVGKYGIEKEMLQRFTTVLCDSTDRRQT